jgi:hypothetical protein
MEFSKPYAKQWSETMRSKRGVPHLSLLEIIQRVRLAHMPLRLSGPLEHFLIVLNRKGIPDAGGI